MALRNSVPTACPVVYSANIPTDTVSRGSIGKGMSSENHEL